MFNGAERVLTAVSAPKPVAANAADRDSDSTNNQKFAAAEHKAIGDKAFQRLLTEVPGLQALLESQGLIDNTDGKLQLAVNAKLKLRPGEIVALAGDFFGIPKEPISSVADLEERKALFARVFATLAEVTDEKGLKEIENLRKLISSEEQAVLDSLAKGEDPKEGFERSAKVVGGGNSNYYYGMATRYIKVPFLFSHSRYFDLVEKNFDHFAGDAKKAYLAGFQLAVDKAKLAAATRQAGNSEEATKQLLEAFLILLYAAHFLTDLFASGHLRTPRRGLVDNINGGKIAGLLAKAMHDEDGDYGLWVTSKKSRDAGEKPWKAYGDHCYFSRDNSENRTHVEDALFDALQHLHNVFADPTVEHDFNPEDYIPEACPPEQVIEAEKGGVIVEERNHQPLFQQEQDGSITRRAALADIHCTKKRLSQALVPTPGHWAPSSTLTYLNGFWFKRTESQSFEPLDEEEREALKEYLESLQDQPEPSPAPSTDVVPARKTGAPGCVVI